MSAAGTERLIRRARAHRAVALAVAFVNAFTLALGLDTGQRNLAGFSAVLIAVILVVAVMQTHRIDVLEHQRERELARPRMTLEDYRHLREMEAGLGWELSEIPADVAASPLAALTPADILEAHERLMPPARSAAPPVACECGEHLPECPEPVRRERQARAPRRLTATASELAASPLSGTGSLSARWDGATRAAGAPGYHERAAEHFAALARVGREHCASYCPICLYRLFGPMPDGVKPDASISMWRWVEENWGWKR